MIKQEPLKIALVGNPNLGKTTLFNKLCGLKQHTGNYPGVTVDKKKGEFTRSNKKYVVTDLPGINSLYPTSKDEELVVKYLMNQQSNDFPDKIVLMVSALNLKRNLYLYEQIRDLNIPMVVAVNMVDVGAKRGVFVDIEQLKAKLDVPVVQISAKSGEGFDELFSYLNQPLKISERPQLYIQQDDQEYLKKFADVRTEKNLYINFLRLTDVSLEADKSHKDAFIEGNNLNVRLWKKNASILRYKHIKSYLNDVLTIDKSKATDFTSRIDRILIHPVFGYLIFLAIIFLIFQSIFWIADYPMGWIESLFEQIQISLTTLLPEGYLSRLVTEGLVPGIGGVVIFIPQISILFFFFSILEESGYMSRIVYLTDRLMQGFGMSGKSIVPLISGMACAIPAIMSARTIENSRERLITILVTPLLTCSARIPVYVLLIALIVPDKDIGIFNQQGLALMAMYLLGVLMTFIVAFILKNIMKPTYKSYLLMEMPEYLTPGIKNVFISMWTNVKSFIWNAGKIIVATTIVLFVLVTNGGEDFKNAESIVTENYPELSEEELENKIASYEQENSYLGTIGKAIEPAIAPLGYDWKIGIALISSLAAREVFVGTISVIYSVGSEEILPIRDRLKAEINPKTGLPAFSFATCISLLLFYAFSLQCMSTVAVTYKETKSLKWTLLQFGYMTMLAYFMALIAFQLLK